jgi:hypothetical protein
MDDRGRLVRVSLRRRVEPTGELEAVGGAQPLEHGRGRGLAEARNLEGREPKTALGDIEQMHRARMGRPLERESQAATVEREGAAARHGLGQKQLAARAVRQVEELAVVTSRAIPEERGAPAVGAQDHVVELGVGAVGQKLGALGHARCELDREQREQIAARVAT